MRIFLIFLLFTILAFTHAGDCNNPLLSLLNFTDSSFATPQNITGAQYCRFLQDGTNRSCCNTDLLNSIQALQDAVLTRLQNFAGARDQTMRDNKGLISQLTQATNDLQTLLAGVTNTTLQAAITADISTLTSFVSSLTATVDSTASMFRDYQANRAICFARLIDIQASAYCLACDAKYVDRGVNNDTLINIASLTCNSIIDVCFPYLQAALSQNKFAAIRKVLDLVKGYSNITADLSGQERPDDRPAGQTDFKKRSLAGTGPGPGSNRFLEPSYEIAREQRLAEAAQEELNRERYFQPPPNDYSKSLNRSINGIPIPMRTYNPSPEEDEIQVPPGCDDPNNIYNCTWLCNQAFQDGIIQIDLLGAGGDRMEDQIQARRLLTTSSTWEPAIGEAGTSVSVTSDPDGVSLTSFSKILRIENIIVLIFGLFLLH